jgi:hypothetical protein
MGRVNKCTKAAFAEIIGTEKTVNEFDLFIKRNNPAKPSAELVELIDEYKTFIDNNRLEIERLGVIEELIMQLRTYENVQGIVLSVVNKYIYARCAFYRKDAKTKDVRTIVGNTEEYGSNVEDLYDKKELMKKAKELLKANMLKVIHNTMERLNDINAKLEARKKLQTV